ncbi:hypothetical protein C2E23DRAFT_131606 [Lenzites betulinus]|nr:hypothetical protein C2E23DRAFT_52533 [Lenzites betulinus]KAH9853175.1 hypothetical protein C2E23DRAFT_131606 [Lenzites betulinus]
MRLCARFQGYPEYSTGCTECTCALAARSKPFSNAPFCAISWHKFSLLGGLCRTCTRIRSSLRAIRRCALCAHFAILVGMPDKIAHPAFTVPPLTLIFDKHTPACTQSLPSDYERSPCGLRSRLFRTQAWPVCTQAPLAGDRLRRLHCDASSREPGSDNVAATLRVLRVRSRGGTQRIARRALVSRSLLAQLERSERAVPLPFCPAGMHAHCTHKIVHCTSVTRRRPPELATYARVHARTAHVRSEHDSSGSRGRASGVISWWVHTENRPRRSCTWSASSATRCVALPTRHACAHAVIA